MAVLTIEDLLPTGREHFEFEAFEPCASYSEPMDQLIYLCEDVSYRADRVDQFLTILWHPHDERVIGIKLKGIRALFDGLQSIVSAVVGKDLSGEAFLPIVGAITLAPKMRGHEASATLQRDREKDWATLTASYEIAMGIAEGVTFDARKLARKSG